MFDLVIISAFANYQVGQRITDAGEQAMLEGGMNHAHFVKAAKIEVGGVPALIEAAPQPAPVAEQAAASL